MTIRHPTTIALTFALLAVALGGTLAAAACSGGDGADDAAALVKSALDRLDDPSLPLESAHITVIMDEEITSPAGPGSLTLQVDGDIDPPKAFRLDCTMKTSGVMQGPSGAAMPPELVYEVVSVDGGTTTFARFPTESDRWLTGMPGMDMTRYFDLRASMRTYLSCADDIEYLRRETVGGVDCDVVRITPDVERLLAERNDIVEAFSANFGEQFDEDFFDELASSATGSATVWIGVDDQLPYKSVSDITLTMAGFEFKVHGEETVTDYGEPVEPPIVAPRNAVDIGF